MVLYSSPAGDEGEGLPSSTGALPLTKDGKIPHEILHGVPSGLPVLQPAARFLRVPFGPARPPVQEITADKAKTRVSWCCLINRVFLVEDKFF